MIDAKDIEAKRKVQEAMDMPSLEGKVTLVTGGARGLGEAICKNLYEAGAIVIPVDVRQDLMEASAGSYGTEPKLMDVRDESQVKRTLREIVDQYGRLDILINNAGT